MKSPVPTASRFHSLHFSLCALGCLVLFALLTVLVRDTSSFVLFVATWAIPFFAFIVSALGLHLAYRESIREGRAIRSLSSLIANTTTLFVSLLLCIWIVSLFGFAWKMDLGKFGDYIGK
jgi:hypothetical protein